MADPQPNDPKNQPDPKPDPKPDPSKPPEGQDVDALPEWARTAIGKANSEAARYRTQVRDLEPLVQKARDADEASKTEVQRAADKTTAAERRAENAEKDLLRLKVGVAKGLNADQLEFLTGDTEDELGQRADKLLALSAASRPSPLTNRPGEQLRAGSDPSRADAGPDMNALIRRQLGRA